jgi:anti-sigma factor RsiW
MNCGRSKLELSAYLDAEAGAAGQGLIGRVAHLRLARHVQGCAACLAQVQDLRSLRVALRGELPHFAAPEAFRARMQALASSGVLGRQPMGERGAGARAGARWAGLNWGAGSGARPGAASGNKPGWTLGAWGGALAGSVAGSLATLLFLFVLNQVQERQQAQDVAAQMVSQHAQASLSGHLFDVASTDQHTVKPWLSQRLDYVPPVLTEVGEGFTLAGGRLETVQGQRVAALVYRYRLHTIDVFVRPMPALAPSGVQSLRGFNIAHAQAGSMDFVAVSDLNFPALQGFVEEIAASVTPPAGSPAGAGGGGR